MNYRYIRVSKSLPKHSVILVIVRSFPECSALAGLYRPRGNDLNKTETLQNALSDRMHAIVITFYSEVPHIKDEITAEDALICRAICAHHGIVNS